MSGNPNYCIFYRVKAKVQEAGFSIIKDKLRCFFFVLQYSTCMCIKARFFLLVDLREFFFSSRLRGGGGGGGEGGRK